MACFSQLRFLRLAKLLPPPIRKSGMGQRYRTVALGKYGGDWDNRKSPLKVYKVQCSRKLGLSGA